MPYAATTPTNVRRAVRIYVNRRRMVSAATGILMGVAAATLVAVAFLVLDRYAQVPVGVRGVGRWASGVCLGAGLVYGLAGLLRCHDPFRVAVRIDQAFPMHRDRWSSSIDFSERMESGQHTGDRASVERLFAETETLPARDAKSIVSHRTLGIAMIVLMVAAVGAAFVALSPAFDVHLLVHRFLDPHADLPRDSSTRIVLTDINGHPFTGAMPDSLPEGSPLNLRVELRRKPGMFAFGQHEQVIDDADQLAPRLERTTAAGDRTTEFARAGTSWVFVQPRLEESLRFRLRVDDALTQTMNVEVTPRIRLADIETGIRYPRYSRIKDQPLGPMQGNRISALADSVVDFRARFDRPFKSVTASYEAIKSEKDANTPDAAPGTESKSTESSRRNLRVQKRGDDAIRFTLPLDASGILRLRGVGNNGLASEEWVCAIEAIPDAPPRIVVSGLEPDMTIVPGETVSFQYRAEDDLAITDIVMDWSVAGGIHQGNLGGEEYLKNKQLGQKVIEGQELIQRMNYAFYATEPFQFFLNAIDSKGQESRTETFRIHVTSDDYTTRFERGMQLLTDTAAYQNRCRGQIGALLGQLKIIETASGGAKTWDTRLNTQLDNFLRTSQNYDDPWFFTKQLTLRYGGVPYRLDRSLQLLMAVPTMLATRGELLSLGVSMKTTDDLPAVIGKFRTLIEGQGPIVEAWGNAIKAEQERFLAERLLNQARGPAVRLAALAQIQQPPDVAAANLKFYLAQIDAWLTAANPFIKDNPEFAPLAEALKSAREHGKAEDIIAALHPIIEKLSSREMPADDALAALAMAMTMTPPNLSDPEDRFATAVARVVTSSGQTELVRPAETMALAKPWITQTTSPTWYPPAPSSGDALLMAHQVWETLRIYRADLVARRFELNPQDKVDHESILRERALSTKEEFERLSKDAINSAQRDKLISILDRMIKPEAPASDANLAADLGAAIRAVGSKSAVTLGEIARSKVELLIAAIRKTADQYDAHADAVTKEISVPVSEAEQYLPSRMLLLDEAARLQTRTEGLESLYRAIKFAVIESRLLQSGSAPEWTWFEPLHGAQLQMSLAASQAGESVTRIHIELSSARTKAGELYPIAARNAHQLGERLRSTATLLEAAFHDKPVTFDYAKLMKDARAEGLFGALKEEYELVRDYASPAAPAARTDAEAKLSKSAMARIVRGEHAVLPLWRVAEQLKKSTGGKVADAVTALKSLQKALPPAPESPPLDALPAVMKEASEARPEESVAKNPSLLRKMQAVAEAVTSLAEGFHDQARLPAINTTAAQNRRFTTRDLPNVWVIGGIIDGFDRRWLYMMRDEELSLTRSMLEVARAATARAPTSTADANGDDLKLQYARMIEWRARNFANDRRRNQGISLLAADSGPTLRLPEHIAEEFLRARNLQTPEDFKPRIESYYEELYRDLAK